MTHGARRSKARRLQVHVTEALARAFDLTILAEKPTLPGVRDGVVWVPEGEPADLKVRVMGQAGADVALLTPRAMKAVALDGHPLYFECKNAEATPAVRLDDKFWTKGMVPKFIERAYMQAKAGANIYRLVSGRETLKRINEKYGLNLKLEDLQGNLPLVVLSRNRWSVIAVVETRVLSGMLDAIQPMVLWRTPPLAALPFEKLTALLDGAPAHAVAAEGQPT